MKLEGGLSGSRKPYPITIYPVKGLGRTKLTVNNDNELLSIVDEIASDENSKKKKILKKNGKYLEKWAKDQVLL